MTTPLEAALGYAGELGWRVFPVHSVEAGACTCLKGADCPSRGKHPRTFNGVTDASVSESRIREWWQMWPGANVGLATGRESGVWVLDIDPRHGGMESLEEWEVMRGDPLPQTLSATSGGGGVHLVWRYPDIGSVRSRNGLLPGVDVKGDGGYVVAPPSRHESGGAYAWRTGGSAALAPSDLLQMVSSTRRSGGGMELPDTARALEGVPEGSRNDTLFRLACRWRRQYREDRDAVWKLLLTAARNCQPALPDEETLKILESAFAQDHTDSPELSGVALMSDGSELEHLTDEGNARRFLRDWARDVRHVPAWGWLEWDGRRWRREDSSGVEQRGRQTLERVHDESSRAADERQQRAVKQWALKSEGAARLDAMLRLARVDPLVSRAADDFDTEKWLLNCRNGVVDLRTGELRQHDRSRDSFTRVAGADYRPEAACPEWHRFMERVLPDEEAREFIRRAVGCSLSGEIEDEVMFVLRGEGANGKTTFVETLRRVIGDYAVGTPTDTIMARETGAATTDLARLKGARFVTAQESDEGEVLSKKAVKSLTGGDEIQARFLYRDLFSFHPQFTLWLSTNHFPIVRGADPALWRRIKIVPFDVVIPAAERLKRSELTRRFEAESAGILAWAVGGCLAWQTGGLGEPAAVLLATERQRKDMEIFPQWLEECCEIGDELEDLTGELYRSYAVWSELRGEHPWTMTAFGRELDKHRFVKTKNRRGERIWRGLKRRDSAQVWGV